MNNRLLYFFLIIMGVLLAFIYSLVPHVGDDVGYGMSISLFSDKFNGNFFLIWPYVSARHWILTNGRLADKLLIGFLYWMPDWLIAIFTSIFWIISAIIILKLINSSDLLLNSCVLAFLWLGMPMWDSSIMTAVAFNYVWSSAFGLIFSRLMLLKINLKIPLFKFLLLLFAFFAGMMHEAMSLPLFIGFIAYEIVSLYREKIPFKYLLKIRSWNFKQYLLLAFGIGVIFVVFSPGLIKRIFNTLGSNDPDDSMFMIFLKSDFLIIPLIFLILFLYLKKKEFLRNLINSYWIIFFIAALFSSFISIMSGIVGRSGWFSQIYSLIAIGIILSKIVSKEKNFSKKIFSFIILSLVVVCYSEILHWQNIRKKEFDIVMNDYLDSDNGIVYKDYIDDYELPWWTLGMTLGVPDPDDTYSIYTIEEYKGNKKPFVILPENLKNWDGVSHHPKLTKGFIANTNITTFEIERLRGERTLLIYTDGNKYFTVNPFVKNKKEFFYVRPLDLDPGTHLPDVD